MAVEVLGAEPDPVDAGSLVVQVRFPTGEPTPVRLRFPSPGKGDDPAAGRTEVRLEAEATPPVPYFSWFMGPILRSASKRALAWVERALRAADAGEPPPPFPKRPSLAPPATFAAPQAVLLATVCAIAAAAPYGSSLLSPHGD